MPEVSHADAMAFLKDLDASDMSLSDWESKFVGDLIDRDQSYFSPKQFQCVLKLLSKYGDRIHFEPKRDARPVAKTSTVEPDEFKAQVVEEGFEYPF